MRSGKRKSLIQTIHNIEDNVLYTNFKELLFWTLNLEPWNLDLGIWNLGLGTSGFAEFLLPPVIIVVFVILARKFAAFERRCCFWFIKYLLVSFQNIGG